NTVPFVFDRTAGTWAELVRQVFGREAELWPHRRFPLPAIQRLAHNRQVPDVYFNYQEFGQVDRKLIDAVANTHRAGSQFPLVASTLNSRVILHADAGLLSQAHVERLGVMFRLVLESMAAGGTGDAHAVFMPPGEISTITGVTGTSADVLDAFAAQVASAPDTVAVIAKGMQISYAELDARSDRLAHHLRSLGVGPGDVVGVLVERSPELLIAMLAVLKSGAGYLPLDAAFPVGRLAGIVADAKPVVVVTQEVHAHTARAVHPGTMVVLDRDADVIDAQLPTGAWPVVDPDVLAYVLYTSGSTGTPKGVEVTRGALANLLAGMREILGAASPASEVWLASTSVSFDISGLELFLPLVSGQCVVLAGDDQVGDADELIGLIRKHGVTHVQATPSGWKVLLGAGLDPAGLTLLVGGEALPLELAGQLRARAERLVHVYGPTETTIWSTAVDMPFDPVSIPLGTPIRNTTVHVLDGHLNPVPSGVAGELFIAGDGLAQGYRGHAALTAERFLPNPYGPPGTRLYRTGDLVRRTLTGELEYLGRSDDQLKIRGYRIEPAEIETALRSHPQVRDAHVTAIPDHTDEPRLTAYLIAAAELGLDEVRRHLRQSLPEYMLPTAVITLDSWPLTAAGKLDRAALPAPELVSRDSVEPRTDTERRLAAVWAEALGLARVGVNETFFDLGGDSIRAVVLVGTARAAGLDLAVRDIFDHPTIAELAQHITGDDIEVDDVLVEPFALVGESDRAALPAGLVDAYPLSQVQTGMVVEGLLGIGKDDYQRVTAFRVPGTEPYDHTVLVEAAAFVVARQEALRTSVDLTTFSAPMQLVWPASRVRVPIERLSLRAGDSAHRVVEDYVDGQRTKLVDVSQAPLFGLATLVEENGSWWLVLTYHHAILEGWSQNAFLSDLLMAYQAIRDGGAVEPPATGGARYADFIAGELESLADEGDQEYWRSVVDGHAAFVLPSGWGEGEEASRATHVVEVPFGDLESGLRGLASSTRTSLKSVLFAAHLKVLSQLTPEESFTTGLVCDARPELLGADRVYGMH
ncbi:amino acid adenylation domain-containing protein, partial [Kitasatospora sp. NPDC097643]|uniref:non-ribosomal peptide synthetase n=1 Tax=Kitasatospora sp. NPDC097643 TaxID=3157230 RepID=UPI003327B964